MNESTAATVALSGVGWQPIAVYDALKKKPKYAVFWVAASRPSELGRIGLDATLSTQRTFGYREVTQFIELLAPPATA